MFASFENVSELIDACRYSDLDEVLCLLKTETFEQGVLDRSLYEAAYASLFGAIEPLVNAGARVRGTYSIGRSESVPGKSALAALIAYGHDQERAALERLVALLLDYGADADLRDERGRTALLEAANYHLVAIARMLLDAGAEPSTLCGREGRQEDALYEVFTREDDHEVMAELTDVLLAAGAQPDQACGAWQRTALMLACRAGAMHAARALIRAGANVNRVDAQGKSAYVLAAQRGHTSICELLLDSGATVSDRERLRAALVDCHLREEWEGLQRLEDAACKTFPCEAWVHQSLSLAHEHCGDYGASVRAAARGLEHEVSDVLVCRLVLALRNDARNGEALEAWERYEHALVPGETDRFLLANTLVIFAEEGRRREGLASLERFCTSVLQQGGADRGLLAFNLACLWSKESEPALALRHLEAALEQGQSLATIEADPDLAELRAHPAYAYVVGSECDVTVLGKAEAWPVREVLIHRREIVEAVYTADPAESAPTVSVVEHADCTGAALATVRRVAELRSEGWTPCEAPAIAFWQSALSLHLAAWCRAQEEGELGAVGAMVVEWDFGESDGERNIWVAGFAEAEESRYEGYVHGDHVLIEDVDAGPCIDTPTVFRSIVEHLMTSDPFASLQKASSVFFVLQEHDAGHTCTVAWRK